MSPNPRFAAVAVAFALAMVAVLWGMGRAPICPCGYVALWDGSVYSESNSQHLLDWYTLSHLIHGFLFYVLAWLISRFTPFKLSLFQMFLLACLLEGGWEILENSQFIINRYREANPAMGYNGDSILNSVSDFLAMATGFWLAGKLPVKATVALALGMELLAAYTIRDNLFFNVQALLFPSKAIADWQTELHAPQKLDIPGINP